MMKLWISTLMLHPLLLDCCNFYKDYCDTMEDAEVVERSERWKRTVAAVDTAKDDDEIGREEMGRRVSRTLDILFGHGYNKQLRPGIGGGRPTVVEVNIAVR